MNSNQSWKTFVITFVLMATVTVALYSYHGAQNRAQAIKLAGLDHAIIVTSKAEYAAGWYRERISDARYIFDSQFKSKSTQAFVFANSGFDTLASSVLWMGKPFGNASYSQVILIDSSGHKLHSRPSDIAVSEEESMLYASRLRTQDSVSFYLSILPDSSSGFINIIVPFFGSEDRTRTIRGAVLRVDFAGYFNTLVSGPRTSSNTRVSYIAMTSDTSLNLIPISPTQHESTLPANLAKESIDIAVKTGIATSVLGTNLHGDDVFVAATTIDNFPWPIVVVQDVISATQVYRLQSNLVGALLLVFLTVSGTSLFFLIRRSRKEMKTAEAVFQRDKSIVETRLQDRSAVYKLLFDKSLDAILVISADGKIDAVNLAACEMFGASEEELTKLDRSDIMDLTDSRSANAIKIRSERGWFRGEVVLMRTNGSRFIAEVSTNRIIDSTGEEKVHVLARDVSESYKTREELERRARHLHESQRVGRLGSWEANLLTGEIHWSENLSRMLSRENLLGPLSLEETIKAIVGVEQFTALATFIENAEWQESIDGRNSFESLNGELLTFQYSIKAMLGPQIEVERLFGSVVDVTELANAEREVRNLIAYLVSAREAERTKIARDIHDELGQMLTAVKIDLSTLGRGLSSQDATRQERIDGTLNLVDSMIQTVKRLTAELRPGILDDLGLSAAIEWQLKQFTSRTNINHHFEFSIEYDDVDREMSTMLFRITQEALTNVARHSQASHVDVRISTESDEIVLTVLDNGIGIPVEATHDSGSFGLLSIQERAAYFGGSAAFETVKIGGTLVVVKIPARKEGERDSSYHR